MCYPLHLANEKGNGQREGELTNVCDCDLVMEANDVISVALDEANIAKAFLTVSSSAAAICLIYYDCCCSHVEFVGECIAYSST